MYTRLPTGHGHSDIDGCFAVIWENVKPIHVNTMDEDAYKKTSIQVEVVDVEAVPEDILRLPN
jgi:hypothetical protein